ncbi:MAG: outer membrane protein assembly factor BamD, partial [Myxococcota bacterium]|nr:outer membrane protein assembly factor BamD [Myxococcota bacterium]
MTAPWCAVNWRLMMQSPRRLSILTAWLLAASVAFSVQACATSTVQPDGAEPGLSKPDDGSPVASARRAYFSGMQELAAGNNKQAVTIFSAVARSPRYVRHAALAKIRIGDAYFNDQRFEEAAQAYRSFVAQHASDPNIPYARFRIASCYYERIPSGVFFAPPDHERDQTATKSAVRELNGFLAAFPTSRFA